MWKAAARKQLMMFRGWQGADVGSVEVMHCWQVLTSLCACLLPLCAFGAS